MSYRPYPSKKPISYGSRHHLMQAYKPPVVRGYGSRSPFQTGSGSGVKEFVVANGTGTDVTSSGNTYFVGVNVGSGLTTLSNNIVTYPSRHYGSFDISNTGNSPDATTLSCVVKSANSFGISVSSNVINTENGAVYEVNGWIHHQLNHGAIGHKTGLAICDATSPFPILLDCTVGLASMRTDPMVSCLTGFFAAAGPIVVRIYNSVSGGTTYMKEGDLSIKRIA